MGVKFLKKGDPQPPPVEAGKLRLYSMLYCPFAQRARLVLAAKGVPFEMVDINLKNKPEWYSAVHPETKVPALEVGGGDVVVESLDVSDYLDRKFPEPPLWSVDQEKNLRHKQLLQTFGKMIPIYMKLLGPNASQAVEDVVYSIAAGIQPFENELAKTGSKYFGGARPGMLDYMIWPWAERMEALRAMHPDVKLPLQDFPRLMAWGAAMKQDPAVRASIMSVEAHAAFIMKYRDGSLDYDKL
ncbi:pyrimidodiazepine synthase-like isoform X2 [Schistocerca piceifrons]|uniref:pyrimidodiazepine synthase-like isoform X1 n=1 Tax=Schistocerca piceifrons TaxID=274613 RepID=UPI001F5FC321|nr:pyrimidodiazepine synthase-like isoform X1 [Schistocerca piceifrons]XP_047099106.1 pyrimidodiazepine synthase-like isoform X2 [Schistocerca piceifrons]